MKKKNRCTGALVGVAVKTALLLAAAFLLFTFVFRVERAEGNTMSPFVRDGDLCIFYCLDRIGLNDVVLYRTEKGEKRIGRVIASEGQRIEFQENGGFTVDGYAPPEEVPYETYGPEREEGSLALTLREDSYFLMNDFRSIQTDSREYGAVEGSRIEGKLLFLLRRRGF